MNRKQVPRTTAYVSARAVVNSRPSLQPLFSSSTYLASFCASQRILRDTAFLHGAFVLHQLVPVRSSRPPCLERNGAVFSSSSCIVLPLFISRYFRIIPPYRSRSFPFSCSQWKNANSSLRSPRCPFPKYGDRWIKVTCTGARVCVACFPLRVENVRQVLCARREALFCLLRNARGKYVLGTSSKSPRNPFISVEPGGGRSLTIRGIVTSRIGMVIPRYSRPHFT